MEVRSTITTNFKLFAKHSIKYGKSAPYSPQQNGVSERMNRTVVEKIRCMLYEAKMSKGFWAEALFAAIDVINVLPNSAIENKVPNEIWNGKKCDVSDFKVFGSKAMLMVPQQKRKKLDKKSIECVFLRKADNANAFMTKTLKRRSLAETWNFLKMKITDRMKLQWKMGVLHFLLMSHWKRVSQLSIQREKLYLILRMYPMNR